MTKAIIPDFLANVPNIEHCSSIRGVGDPAVIYFLTTEEGWFIRRSDLEENVYKTSTTIRTTESPSILTILAEADLPEDAEILAEEPETEVASAEDPDEPNTEVI